MKLEFECRHKSKSNLLKLKLLDVVSLVLGTKENEENTATYIFCLQNKIIPHRNGQDILHDYNLSEINRFVDTRQMFKRNNRKWQISKIVMLIMFLGGSTS